MTRTFAILKKIDVQGHPDGYLNDPYNHHVYILSHAEPNITVLDDKDGSILGTINMGGAPEQAATDGHGKIYVDIEDKAAIPVIDANTMKMIGRYDVSSKGSQRAGLALDAKNNILFAACRRNKNMVILPATDGHIITDLPIGNGCDGVTFNPETEPGRAPVQFRAARRLVSNCTRRGKGRQLLVACYSWHCNRHTFASRLVMAGVDLRTVPELLGHRTLQMVGAIPHFAPEHQASAADQLVGRENQRDTKSDTSRFEAEQSV